jgi:transposase
LLIPTEVHLIDPAPCAGGHDEWAALSPYHTHQVIELPPIEMDITHFILQQGQCAGWG